MAELILGGAPLGGLFRALSDRDADATMAAAWACGIRAFDTAPHYGVGLSEQRLGRFLAGRSRTEFTLSTKVGRLLVPDDDFVDGREGYRGTPALRRVLDYSADGVRRSLEESLVRLGLDRVDRVLIHDPDEHWEQAVGSAYPALERLRGEGVVAEIGVGMNQVAMLRRFVAETDLDCVMVAGRFSLLDRSAEPLLDECYSRGVQVCVAGVFNSGLLADPDGSPTYDYAPAPAPLVARARRMAALCNAHGVALPAAAIQFALRDRRVASVAVGARSAEEVRANVEHARGSVPSALWSELGTQAT